MKLIVKKIFIGMVVVFCFIENAIAQDDVRLTDKELARESVLPVIENPESIRNRNVSKAGSLSLYPLGGVVVNNPFFLNLALGGTIGYHFNEYHSVNLFGAYMYSTKTQYVNQIIGDEQLLNANGGRNRYLQGFENFPKANLLALLMYEFSPLYGKMSFSKNMVLNTDLLLSLGGGTIIFSGGAYLPAFTVGLGQRFYFGKNWGIRFDLIGLMYSGPNYTSFKGGDGTVPKDTSYVLDDFNRQFTFHFLCSVGFVVLF